MNKLKEWAGILALVIAAIFGGSVGFGAISSPATVFDFVQFQQGFQMPAGPSVSTANWGSQVQGIFRGTCSLIGPSFVALAASSSLPFDCAVTGVQSGDVVMAQFATSSSAGAGWLVTQASASSTNGFITLRIVNNTGTTATIPASIASSTSFFITR